VDSGFGEYMLVLLVLLVCRGWQMLFAGDLGGFAVLRCCLGVGTCLRLG